MTLHRGFKKSDFSAPAKAFQIEMHPHAKLVYLYLLQMLDVEGDVFPGYATIARTLCISRNGARNAIDELVKLGLVEKIRRKKKNNPKENDSNEYIVFHPDQVENLVFVEHPAPAVKSAVGGMPPHGTGGMPQDGIGHDMAQGYATTWHRGMPQDGTGGMPPHGTYSVVDVVDVVVENDDDSQLTTLELIRGKAKTCFPKYRLMSLNQAEKIWKAAQKHNMTVGQVIEQIQLIADNVKIKKSPFATIYTAISEGGWQFDLGGNTSPTQSDEKPKPDVNQPDDPSEPLWKQDLKYQMYRNVFVEAGADDINRHDEHYPTFVNTLSQVGSIGKLISLAEKYIAEVKAGRHEHKTPQIVWFLHNSWKQYDQNGTEQPKPSSKPKKLNLVKLPHTVAKQVNKEMKSNPMTPEQQKEFAEKQARVQAKLKEMHEKLGQAKQEAGSGV